MKGDGGLSFLSVHLLRTMYVRYLMALRERFSMRCWNLVWKISISRTYVIAEL